MIGLAGQKVAGPARDAEALAIFRDMAIRGRKRMDDQDEARKQANRKPVRGGED